MPAPDTTTSSTTTSGTALARPPINQAPGGRTRKRVVVGHVVVVTAEWDEGAIVHLKRQAGYGRIVVVGRVKELVGRILDHALWAGSSGERQAGYFRKLVRGGVDDIAGNAVRRC